MLCNYLQTRDKNQMMDFIKSIPDECTVEITVHSEQRKLKASRVQIRIDDELVYDFDFVKKEYHNFKRFSGDGQFYLTDAEAFALNLYVCNLSCETAVVPHWWPYAERNIARHSDPLADLRVAQEQRRKIVVTVE